MNPTIIGALAHATRPAAETAWRFFRLTCTNIRGFGVDNSNRYMRIAEWQLFNAANTQFPTAAMTANNAPSPLVASAISTLSGFEPFQAFNNNTGDSSRWISADAGPTTKWLQIDLGAGNEITPTYTKIAPDGGVSIDGGHWMVDFRIDGSNTGAFAGEETLLFSVAGLNSGWANNTLRTFTF